MLIFASAMPAKDTPNCIHTRYITVQQYMNLSNKEYGEIRLIRDSTIVNYENTSVLVGFVVTKPCK